MVFHNLCFLFVFSNAILSELFYINTNLKQTKDGQDVDNLLALY